MNREDYREIRKVIGVLVAFIVLATIGQFCTGCSPRIITIETEKHVRDTLVRERIIRDSVVVPVPYEVEKVVTRDSSSHLENSFAKSDAGIKDGMLYHTLESKPQDYKAEVLVPVRDTVIVTQDAETIIKEVEKKLNWWQRVRLDGFWVLLIILGAIASTSILSKKLTR